MKTKSAVQHTPEPQADSVGFGDGDNLVFEMSDGTELTMSVFHALAAPELLEALKKAQNLIHSSTLCDVGCCDECIDSLELIARAEGK